MLNFCLKLLNHFLKYNVKNDKRHILWQSKTEAAFDRCKEDLAKSMMEKELYYYSVDDSNTAVEAVLQQLKGDRLQPLGFFLCEKHEIMHVYTFSTKMWYSTIYV